MDMTKEAETNNDNDTQTQTPKEQNSSNFRRLAKKVAFGFCIGFTVTTLAAAAYILTKPGTVPAPTENS